MDEPSHVKDDASAEDQRLTKKPYQQPTLIRWGSLRDLTMSIGGGGRPDGGTRGNARYTGRGGLYVIDSAKP